MSSSGEEGRRGGPRLASCQETELGAPPGGQILRLLARAPHVFQAIGETAGEGQLDVCRPGPHGPLIWVKDVRVVADRQAGSLFPGDSQAAGQT